MIAFACIVGTSGVSVWADDTCKADEYLDIDTNECKQCPLEETNAAGKVKSNETDPEPYVFVKNAGGKGKKSCAVKLSSGHSCDNNNTFVLYVYDTVKNNYIRTRADVYPTGNSIINDVWPAEDELGTDFCTSCDGITWSLTDSNGQQRPFHEYYYGTPFNIENKCTSCGKPGFYVEKLYYNYVCSVCPAGFYCPGSVIKEDRDGNRVCLRDDNGECLRGYMGAIIWDYDPETSRQAIQCSKDEYSEEGASKCLSCAPGYSTAQSGPVEDGYDGLCLRRENGYGVRCISSDACKLTMSLLSVGSHTFSLGDNVKIESVNKSVIKSFSYENPEITNN